MNDLDAVVDKIRQGLLEKSAARERALALSRETIRTSANAIRAIHRHEFDKAETMAGEAGRAIHEASQALAVHPDILYAGFIHDAAKEFAEARIVLTQVREQPLPTPEELNVEG